MELMRLRSMQLYYRPPNSESHLKLQEALNVLWEKTHDD